MIEEQNIDLLIGKYLSGEATQEERAAIELWTSRCKGNRTTLDLIGAYWKADVTLESQSAETREKVMSRIRKGRHSIRNRILTWSLAAACAGLAIGLSFRAITPAPSGTYTLVSGDTPARFTLPDGTAVVLNRDSRLTYDSGFGKKGRAVTLSGEGWFDVMKDGQSTFSVRLEQSEIVVCGTVFDATDRPGEQEVRVALVSGSVLFRSGQQSVRLSPGKMLTFDRGTGEISVNPFEADLKTSWKDGIIRYRAMPIRDVIEMLAREKGANLILSEGIFSDEDLISGAMESYKPFDYMLMVLSEQVHFTWTKSGDQYSILK